MELWELSVSVTKFSVAASQTSCKSRTAGVASEYARILDEKISNIKADVEQMEIVREQLDDISDMHEELTGEIKIDEDSGNANRDSGGGFTKKVELETVKRFMPDGTIVVTTYEGSKIVEQVRHKPHMIVAPDYTAPPKPDGSVATELKPIQNFDLELLLMM